MKTDLQQMTEVEMADKAERRRPPLVDLGWANGWRKTPPLVRDCKHKQADLSLGPCVHQVTCVECGFTYKYDSGDCGS